MAPYTTPEDIRKLLDPAGEQGPGSAASLDDIELQKAADRAEAEINARLSGRYSVPLIDPPLIVGRIATDLAAYDATLSFYGSTDISDDDPVIRRYRDSKYLLMDISVGKADLYPGAGGGEPESGGRASVRNPYEGRLFGMSDFGIGHSGSSGWWPDR